MRVSLWLCCFCALAQCLSAQDKSGAHKDSASSMVESSHKKLEEHSQTTQHSITIEGRKVPYEATVGNLIVKNEKENDVANISYVSYRRTDVKDTSTRPITFCFNGGPGSSSVWLHIGVLGPQRLATDDWGVPKRPAHVEENPYSLLDKTDLVFIDPVSTGYSRTVEGEDPKQFHSVEGDINSLARFIRLYISKYGRWGSPKYIAGESYGTTRAAGLALQLLDEHNLQVEGLFLISCILNFQPYFFDKGNELPYVTYLPTYTAAAWYHKKLSPELQKDFQATLQKSIAFTQGEYAQALFLGDALEETKKNEIAAKLSQLTGLSEEFILENNLRIDFWHFAKRLLHQQGKVIGRFDGRLAGVDDDPSLPWPTFDPSFEAVLGPFTAAFNDYMCRQLQCQRQEEYMILPDIGRSWDYGVAKNKYLDMSEELKKVMTKNPHLRVLVASGYFDFATPFYATEYTLKHLHLPPSIQSHLRHEYYDAGHMMYLNVPAMIKLRKDMVSMFSN